MALGTGVHNMSLVVRAHNRASRALASVNRDLTLLDTTRRKIGKGFQQLASIGALAIKALAIAIAGGVAGAIVAYSRFDDALTGSLAIVEDVSPRIREQLEDTARRVAKTTIFSASQAAGAYFSLFSAGQDVASAMRNLPTVAQFAQAGLFDLSVATELLVTSQNALGLAFEDPIKNAREMKRVADVLAAADENAVGTIEDFANALTNRAAAAMRTYNIDVEEGVAVLAAWATQGLKGKTAGEAFAIVTRDLQKAALNEADAWREAGAAVFDRQGNMRDLADIVGDLEDAMRGLTDAQKKQLLSDLGFQERSQQRLLQLLGTSDAIRQFEKDFLKAGGTVERVAEKQLDSAIKQLVLLKNAVVDLFIGAGKEWDKGFVDVIKDIRGWVNDIAPAFQEGAADIAESISNLIDKAQMLRTHWKMVRDGTDQLNSFFYSQFNPTIAKVIELIDNLIRKWSELSQPVRDAIGDWVSLLPWITLAAGAFKIIAVVIGLIGGPATIVAGIIAGLIVLFQYLWENSEEFRAVVQGVLDWVQETMVPILEEAWVLIQEAGAAFLEWFQTDALPWLLDLWEQVKDTFEAAWEFIVALFELIIPILTQFWDNWGADILAIAGRWWGHIKTVIENAWRIIEGIFKVFTGILTLDWSKLWEGLTDIFGGLWNILYSALKMAWDNFTMFVSGVWDQLKEDWSTLWEGFKDAVRGPLNWVLERLEGFVNSAIDVLNGLIDAANKVPGVNIGKIGRVNIPTLAEGGRALREGLALVGERGPEFIRMTRGAEVVPLDRTTGGMGIGGFHVDQLVFQGVPNQMIRDWRRETKLILRGM